MADPGVRVLYGDSSESNLDPNVLDAIVQLVVCSREVADAVVEWENLELQRSETIDSTASLIADLDKFVAQAEFGLRATAEEMKRPEMTRHGEEVVTAVKGLVEGWRKGYLATHETERTRIEDRLAQLQKATLASMERIVLLLRTDASERSLHRVLEHGRYHDEAIAELVPGVKATLLLTDVDPEQPRRLRTLVGKGQRIQVGMRRSRLRRADEPNFVNLDDMLLLELAITPERARLLLAKKAASKDVLRLELAARGDGADGAAVRSGGTAVALPESDRPVLAVLWRALQAEAQRVVESRAKLVGLQLDDADVEDAPSMLDCLERFVDAYRPIVRRIAARSPNGEELTIKVERDGKREEAWIRRDELAQHYQTMPGEPRRRLAIAELDPASAGSRPPPPPAPKRERGAPEGDVVEDISLQDVELDDDAAKATSR